MFIALVTVLVAAAPPSGAGDLPVAATTSKRGPVATGTVLGVDGRLAIDATVFSFLRLAGGTISNSASKVAADGTFALPHPRPEDLSDAAEPTQLVMWAKGPSAASAPIINRSGPVEIHMRAYDATQLSQVRVVALDGTSAGRWGGDLQVLLAPGRVGRYGPVRLKAGRSLELDEVIPGPHALLFLDDVGFHVGDEITIEAAKKNVVEMPFAVDIPEGRVGVSLTAKSGGVTAILVVPGSPAQRAGLKMGDEILAIDGQPAADVQRTTALLQGKAGETVRVTVRRGQGSQELNVLRSGPPQPARAKLQVEPLEPPDPDLVAAAAFVKAGAGERILEVAPLFGSARRSDEPFGVQVPHGVGLLSQLRVIVDFGDKHFYRGDGEHGIPIVITAVGPNDLAIRKEYLYYNRVRDPLGRGADTSASGPNMGFEAGELDTEGVYRLTVSALGRGDVQRSFRVTGPFTQQSYQRHQHVRIASYEMRARAILELQPTEGSPNKAYLHRAVFTSGKHSIEVDMLERRSGGEVNEWFFATPPWPRARDVWLALRRQTFKLHRDGASFVAAWPSGNLVVRVRGTRWGKEAEQVVDHYVMFYESKWRRDAR